MSEYEYLAQKEWGQLVRFWRTRANENFERAKRAEAAYERADLRGANLRSADL